MTQEHPLAVVAYRVGIIKLLTSTYPDVTQTWYTDDSGSLGTFDNLEQYFKLLRCNGPDWGYYPNPTKSILVVNIKQTSKRENYFSRVTDLWCAWAHVI